MTEAQDHAENKFQFQSLWSKYEDIAMHFNDLLMRLRSQSLAAIAAISTLFGIFSKSGADDIHADWLIGTGIFTAATIFWVAIWCLDFLYYNRLLLGAVTALAQIESESTTRDSPSCINMSTLIEAEFRRPLTLADFLRFRGILLFYLIVLVALVLGIITCVHMYLGDP